jgi:hypothetical protein
MRAPAEGYPGNSPALRDVFKNKTLAKARQNFEAGDRTEVLRCMYLCMLFRVPPPDWLRDAFCDRVGAYNELEKWEDAFGPPMPKGTKKAGRQEKRNLVPLAVKVQELRRRGVRGRNLYELAAKELGLRGGWEAVRDQYYRIPKQFRILIELSFVQLRMEIIREKIKNPDGPLPREKIMDKWLAQLEDNLRRISPR